MRHTTLIALAAVGCGTPWIEAQDGEWRTLTTQATSNGAGNFKVRLKPALGESAMLVTLRPDDDLLDGHVRFAQQGSTITFRADEVVASDRALTNAGYIGHTVSFNWPITDGFLEPRKQQIQFGMVDRGLQYTAGSAEVSVVLKNDLDLDSGRLRVNIVFAGNTRADVEVTRAVDDAVEIWKDMYANAAIELEVSLYDWDGPGILQAPGQGNLQEWEEISDQTPFGAVNVVILEDIAGGNVYGFSGDIPGPLVSSGRSGVAVSVALAAGQDGAFDATELQLLAETMAHETGHYLGLYHPVETSYQKWDALDDTVDCNSEPSCVDLMGTNLMFPFPICTSSSCIEQSQITDDQVKVAQRYTGVL